MKNLLGLFLFVMPFVFSQSNQTSDIPDNLLGSWIIEQPGEGQVPSQIFRWKFSKIDSKKGESEFHWLFKRQEDKDYIAVAILVSDFSVNKGEISTNLTKVGSMQKETMKMEFYNEVKWHFPGDSLFEKTDNKQSTFRFDIENNMFIIKEDYNNDGDFDDGGETQKYLKEEITY